MIFEFSAGGIVIRGTGEKQKILLIKTNNLNGEIVWAFPKGHIEKGESPEDAAIREVKEETGYDCKIFDTLKNTGYWFYKNNKLVKKTVKWYLMNPIRKSRKPDVEVLKIRWLGIKSAEKILSYENDKNMVKELLNGK